MALATLGLASEVCGSVFGLLSTAVTRTYLPPIWLITLAYSFSAPTATMTFALSAAAARRRPAEHAVASKTVASRVVASRVVTRAGRAGAATPLRRRGG